MPSLFEKVIWVLKKATKSAAKSTAHYLAHPSEAWEDLVTYAKENPKEFALSCALITAGVLVIVVPLIIGFGPAGPILGSIAAGWQSGIGIVAAGSLFSILQSMAMTGAFTAIGLGLIGSGLRTPLILGFGRWVKKGAMDVVKRPVLWFLSRYRFGVIR